MVAAYNFNTLALNGHYHLPATCTRAMTLINCQSPAEAMAMLTYPNNQTGRTIAHELAIHGQGAYVFSKLIEQADSPTQLMLLQHGCVPTSGYSSKPDATPLAHTLCAHGFGAAVNDLLNQIADNEMKTALLATQNTAGKTLAALLAPILQAPAPAASQPKP